MQSNNFQVTLCLFASASNFCIVEEEQRILHGRCVGGNDDREEIDRRDYESLFRSPR